MKHVISIGKVGRAAGRRASPNRYIIGIDEVGRGPLAGPVVVAAVALPLDGRVLKVRPAPLRDSKKLTRRQRELWASHIESLPMIKSAIVKISPKEIDRLNISGAANRAARLAYRRLVSVRAISGDIYLDGGLYLGSKAKMPKNAKTVVRGDEKIPAISVASIIAKVYRDRLMTYYDRRYPRYGFATNKGYGTVAHLAALKKYGPTPIHRKSFLS